MATNKVVFGTTVLVDLTGDTVTPEDLVTGHTAHDKSGTVVTGTNPYEKTAMDTKVNTSGDLIEQIKSALESKAGGSGGVQTASVTINYRGTIISTTDYEVGSFINIEPGYSSTVDRIHLELSDGTIVDKYCSYKNSNTAWDALTGVSGNDIGGTQVVSLSFVMPNQDVVIHVYDDD